MNRALALVASGRVINVIVGDPALYPGAIDVTDLPQRPAPGWAWVGGTSFTPPADVPVWLGTRITRLAFRQRLTDPVLVAIELASIDNPAATPAQRQFAAQLRVMAENVRIATYIDLARPDTRAGVQALEAAGLLPAGRALQILDAPVQPNERWSE